MIIAVIWGLIVGNTMQLQLKFDHCKEQRFKGAYCELPKKLSKLESK